ncbi:MAG: HEAT repeat domain-containing protein [Candidatus Eremiobacterota bacterium]
MENAVLKERYRIIKTIKAGGMGMVYLAEDIPEKKLRAIKVMFNQGEASEQQLYAIKRFREEAEILARLDHPNIPSITDYFTDKGNYYLVMDYIKGEDLESFLRKCNLQVPEKFVVIWAVQLCDVLSYLHNHKPHPILYRDLKPANVILKSEESRIFLIDFGIARVINPVKDTQKTAVGTEGYAPLEQYKGNPEPRSDVYALGATMHHLLTGIVPIPFSFQPIRQVRDWLSSDLEKIVMKALENEIDNRYTSAKDMKEQLLNFCKENYFDAYKLLLQPMTGEKTETVTLEKSPEPVITPVQQEKVTAAPVKPSGVAARPVQNAGQPAYGQVQGPYRQVQGPYGQGPYGQVPNPYGQVQGPYGQVPNPYGQVQGIYGQVPGQYPAYPYGYPPYGQATYGRPPAYNQVTGQNIERPMNPAQISSAFAQASLGQRTIFNQVTPESEQQAIYSQTPQVKEKATSRVMKEPKDEIEKLIYMLQSNDDCERTEASNQIVQMNLQDGRLVEPLIEALNDWDWNVRREAALALGNQRNKKAVTPLIRKLKDEQPPVRVSAIESLGKLGDMKVIHELIGVLKEDLDEGVRKQAVLSMGEIGNDIVIPDLIMALKDNGTGVRKAAVEVLGSFKDHRAIPHLEKATRDPVTTVALAAKKSLDRLRSIL